MASVNPSLEDYRTLVKLVAEIDDIRTIPAREGFLRHAGLAAFIVKLNFDVEPASFSSQLISKLEGYGTLEETGQPALVSLLRSLRERVKGREDDVAFVDRLLAPYGGASPGSTPTGTSGPRSPRAVIETLKILYLAANPRQTNPLRLGEEVKTIKGRLREAQVLKRIDLEPEFNVPWYNLSLYLLENQPHVVHFAGHGAGAAGLVFEADDGSMATVSGATLGRLFETLRDNVRCVVLNACWSDAQAEAIGAHIDFVVGMTSSIPDDAAIRFAAGFYRGLGFGRSIKEAVNLGLYEIGGAGDGAGRTPDGEPGEGRDITGGQSTPATPDPIPLPDIPRLSVRPGADAGEVLLGGKGQ